MYEFGDSSINAISNPIASSNSSNTITTSVYTVTNVTPTIGTIWPATIQPYDNALLFLRSDGVYGVFGSSVKKISDKLNALFPLPIQPQPPTACVVTINGILCYVLTILVADPFDRINRPLLLCWDGKHWFFANQNPTIKSVSGPIYGDDAVAYGDDGTNVYQIFFAPNNVTSKKIITKFYGADSALYYKQALRFYISAATIITYDIVLHTETGDIDLGVTNYPDAAGPAADNFYGGRLTVMGRDAQGAEGRFLGWVFTSTSGGLGKIAYMALAYERKTPYY